MNCEPQALAKKATIRTHLNTTRLAFHQTQGMLPRAMAFQANIAKRIWAGV